MKTRKTRKSSRKSNHKQSDEKKALQVICPTCGAWEGKSCKHTSKSKKGKRRSEPHPDRIKLAMVELSSEQRKKIAKAQLEAPVDPKKKKLKEAKEKLTPEQAETVKIISEKIEVLGKHAEFVGPVTVGPIISTYRYFPLRRTKVAHLEVMHKDFAVALGAEAVLVKRMPGESAVGVFVPNKNRKKVEFRETLHHSVEYMQDARDEGDHLPIPINFGVDSNGEPFVDDLTTLPHLLVAGTTGGGKSTFLHGVVNSLGWVMDPSEVKLYISDTKGVEFKHFAVMPHLLDASGQPRIATDLFGTMGYFSQLIEETQLRMDIFGKMGVRNIHEYNETQPEDKRMPYIVIIIDELADIMGPSLERAEAKLNSDKLSVVVARSRASGIYCIAATQRPDVKQIRGSIKANFPARLSFRLPSSADSKTILNTKGAEALMSRGDMLYISAMSPDLKRLHAPYMTLDESKQMMQNIVKRYAPEDKVGTAERSSTLNWAAQKVQ